MPACQLTLSHVRIIVRHGLACEYSALHRDAPHVELRCQVYLRLVFFSLVYHDGGSLLVSLAQHTEADGILLDCNVLSQGMALLLCLNLMTQRSMPRLFVIFLLVILLLVAFSLRARHTQDPRSPDNLQQVGTFSFSLIPSGSTGLSIYPGTHEYVPYNCCHTYRTHTHTLRTTRTYPVQLLR